jgi:electron transfer flavoprotein alpha subunit
VNTDPDARIFRHADVGAVADAGAVVRALLVR